jgi:hypothetical protein
VCSVRLAEEVCVDGHETTLLSLKSYPPGFLKKMVLELGSHLDTIHAVQVGISIETTLLSLKSYPPGFLKKMVLELGSHLDTIHAVQVGISPVLRIRDPVPCHPWIRGG